MLTPGCLSLLPMICNVLRFICNTVVLWNNCGDDLFK